MARKFTSWIGPSKDCNVSLSESRRPPLPPRPVSHTGVSNPGTMTTSTEPSNPRQNNSLNPNTSVEHGAVARPMSIATDLEENLLQCAICMEPYDIPKSLKCQHVFCLSCLVRLLETASKVASRSTDTISCPTCRAVTRVPTGGLSKLPASHLVNSLADLTKRYKERRQSKQEDTDSKESCAICKATGKDTKAARFCFSCAQQMCSDCSGKHNGRGSFRSHVLTDITKQGIGCVVCAEHDNQFITSFCVVCNVPVCGVCLLSTHSDHRYVGFTSVKPGSENTSRVLVDKLQQTRARLQKEKMKNDAVRSLIIQDRNSFKDNLLRHYERQIEMMQEEQHRLLLEAEDFFEDVDSKICSKGKEIDRGLQQLTQHECDITNKTIPVQGLNDIALDTSSSATDVVIQQLEGLCSDKSLTVRCKFHPGLPINLGRVESQCVFPDDASVSARTPRNMEAAPQIQMKWHAKNCEHIMGLCILESSAEIVALTNLWPKFKLENHDKDGRQRPLPNFLKKNEHFLYRLHQHDNYTAILSKSETETFSMLLYKKDKHINTIPYRGEGEPRAILVRSNGELIIASIKPETLSCQSSKGELLWLKKKSAREFPGYFEFPMSLLNNNFNQIIVVDGDNRRVHVYDTRGDHLFSFPSEVDENFTPVSACLDGDSILVASKNPLCTVSRFDSSGNLVKHLVRLPYEPTVIQCLPQYRILIVGTWGNGLMAYDLSQLG